MARCYQFLCKKDTAVRSSAEGREIAPLEVVMLRRPTLRFWMFAALANAILLTAAFAFSDKTLVPAEYSVLQPITSGNLTIFPVVTKNIHDASSFLTLDEGVRTGAVVITETSQAAPLVRRQGVRPQAHGAEVNRLVLINNSNRPLLLLAGEIVTGGKQDRVIGADRIVPPKSDPVDLSVFCVEPGRWVERSDKFSSMGGQMAQPSVRRPAMDSKSQQEVWANVGASNRAMAKAAPAASQTVEVTTSYAGVMQDRAVNERIDKVAAPIQQDYQKLIRQLRQRNATGVVVAINGEIVWADIFASPDLLEAYWPKLVRSYAAEAVTNFGATRAANLQQASDFLSQLSGTREVVETEPGVYRRSEASGDGFKVFNIVSLLPKTNFPVHLAKMADVESTAKVIQPMIRR
jgi:sulfur carrier protein ThiS